MKKIKYFKPIFVFAFMLAIAGCKQEGLVEPEVQLQFDIEKSIMDKMGAEEGALVLEQIYNPTTNGTMRAPITYNGRLCPGVVNSGTAPVQTCCGFGTAEFWFFSADAGDVVTIEVDRVNCEMDPIIVLYEGFGDDTALTMVDFADDNDTPACSPGCFSFADPIITGVVLPTTGVYTLAVWDFISGTCAVPPLTYDVVVTGQNTCDADGDGCPDDMDPHPNSNVDPTVVIDGCDSGVDNVFIGCSTMNDLIADCAAAAGNHDDFVSCVAHLTNDWNAAGLITGKEKGAIQRCAAQSNIP